MEAKEKAINLYESYFWNIPVISGEGLTEHLMAKKFSLITIDEILDTTLGYFDDRHSLVTYWQQVKKEINKL